MLVFSILGTTISFILPMAIIGEMNRSNQANAGVQNPRALTGIVLMVSVTPAVLFLIGASLMRKMPITRDSFNKIREELERRRALPPVALAK